MKSSLLLFGMAALIFMGLQTPLPGQDSAPTQYLHLDDWTYDLIHYWVNSGELELPFVLHQPYSLGNFKANLLETKWSGRVLSYLNESYGKQGYGRLLLYARDHVSLVTKDDLPVRAGETAAPVADVLLFDNRSKNHYNFVAQFNVTLPHLSLVNRTTINSELLDDPLYFGDTGEWIYGRLQDAYLNANFGGFDLFLGRTDRNWGIPGSPSLILSNNPYSYDQALISYTHSRFKFSFLVARLEDMRGRNFQGAFPDSLFESRRFLSAHRLDLSLSPNLQLALTEAVTYGGPERDFELSLANPMSFFYLVQRNQREQVNGIWALDLFYKPHQHWNLFLQFLLDDIILNNEPGQDDRAAHPDRLGINLRASQADAWLRGLQTGIEYTRIGNRTYQSFRTWENFHYRQKGLGYPTASVERVGLFANYVGAFPAILKLSLAYERAGDVEVTDIFTGDKDATFPVNTVQKMFRTAFELRYVWSRQTQVTAKFGLESFQSYRHVAGADHANLFLVLGVHANLGIGLPLAD